MARWIGIRYDEEEYLDLDGTWQTRPVMVTVTPVFEAPDKVTAQDIRRRRYPGAITVVSVASLEARTKHERRAA